LNVSLQKKNFSDILKERDVFNNSPYMAETGPEIQQIVTKSVADGKTLKSCKENIHPDPAIGHEFVLYGC